MTALRGSCLCGGVRFEVTEASPALRYCHCESCKKLSGGAATVNLRVPSAAVRILEGEDLLQTFRPEGGSAKTVCRTCGSKLFGGGRAPAEEAGPPGAATVNLRVPSAAVRILEGEDLLQTFRPEGGSAKTFCRTCGSNLFGGGWPESENASLRVPAIDDPFEARPGAHIFVRSAAQWETLPDDGAERFETTPS